MTSSPFRRLCHWGPISVLVIIKLITWAMIHMLGMWWPPHASLGGFVHAAIFLAFAAATLYYFLQSLLEGPGFVPYGWKPAKEEDTQFLQFCNVCNGYKAPRSHHCRKCGRCVMKMDHHCPWINCCVGHRNHCYFVIFLGSATIGCLQAAIVLTICVYQVINRIANIQSRTERDPAIYLTVSTFVLTLLALGMALGVVLAVGALLYIQVRSIFRNRTTIEDWIMEKAVGRRVIGGVAPFMYPYDLGWRRNATLVINSARHDGIAWPLAPGCGQYDLTVSFAMLPLFTYPYDLGWRRNAVLVINSARHDGIAWPLAPGCGQYDLTREQQAQKQLKALRSRVVVSVASYSGRWLPAQYPRAALHAPCTDEPRLALRPGTLLRVTRHRKYWMFGAMVESEGEEEIRGPRGWFPRAAVRPLHDKPE
ncbi:palmitoyltransferase ZDHHC6-like [Ostrinia nubilalis]|uniref:palmitoyltransferase ZDHHC6-like n=1 Tax=Ostrinia nubilalis TaxID=29057 RepID=UPI0030823A4C